MEYLEEELEKLLKEKAYRELSAKEAEYVHAFLSEEEYTQYQLVLSQSVATLNSTKINLKPAPFVASNLNDAFTGKYKKPFALTFSIFHVKFQVPIFRAGFAVFVLMVVLYFFTNKEARNFQLVTHTHSKPIFPADTSNEVEGKDSLLLTSTITVNKNKLSSDNQKITTKQVVKGKVILRKMDADRNALKEIEEYLLSINPLPTSDSLNNLYLFMSDIQRPGMEGDTIEALQ